jgi:methylated-DNA-protein-cysteine methyltransferase related protein
VLTASSGVGGAGGGARRAASVNGRAARAVGFTARVKAVLRAIPRGRIVSYGQVAQLAGNPGASRQVVRILHTCAGPERLPWHRVLRKNGEIALPPGRGGEEQRARLEEEGVEFGFDDRVDLDRFAWRPRRVIRPVPKGAAKVSSKVRSKVSRKA